MEPSAVAARRTRTSLALAVGGAIVLMAGVALILTGEAMQLEHPVHPRPLIVPGLILVVLGFALGVSAAVTILLDAPTRLPSAHPPSAHPPSEHAPDSPPPAGQAPDDPARYAEAVAGEVLASFRLPDPAYPGGDPGPAPPGPPAHTEVVPGAALSPPGRDAQAPAAGVAAAGVAAFEVPAVGVSHAEVSPAGVPAAGVPAAREPLAAAVPPSPWFRPGQPGHEQPSGEALLPGGELPGYSDAGWEAGAASSSWPEPPAEPPHEIHHPVRR